MVLVRSSGLGRPIVAAIVLTAILLLSLSLWGQERRAPKKLKAGSSCTTKECHGKLSVGPTVHSPVAKKSCDACHEQDEETEHKFTYPDTGAELCYGCHKSVTKKKHVHRPLKDAKRPCLTCHDPHSSAAKHLVKAETTSALCLQCHTDLAKGSRLHKSRPVKGCTGCHVPHSSESPKFLRSRTPKLCYSCHEGIQEDVKDAQVVHGPINVGCASCHDPHRPLTGKGLKKSGADLCMGCHIHFKDRFSAMSKRHPQLREKKDCLRCHRPHAGPRKSLLVAAPRKLCLQCHENDIKSKRAGTIKGLGAELVKGARLHGPLASGDCAGCHEPHGNNESGFVRKAYPPTFYSPYKPEAYALCFSCHDASLAGLRRTTVATRFRDGNVNLHHLHVNRKKKGRTCRACHSPHASKAPYMLADSVPFGEWKVPIRFREEKDGGTCASGCHLTKTYSRAKPGAATRASESRAATRPRESSKTTTSPAGNVSGDAP